MGRFGRAEKGGLDKVGIDLQTKTSRRLGLKDWRSFNLALLGKWRWRLLLEEESLWGKVMIAKYDVPLYGERAEPRGTSSSWWKDLMRSCSGGTESCWFDWGVERKIGKGNSVRFWSDTWCRHFTLKDRYLRLYNLSLQKDAIIFDLGTWTWNFSWRGPCWTMSKKWWRRCWFSLMWFPLSKDARINGFGSQIRKRTTLLNQRIAPSRKKLLMCHSQSSKFYGRGLHLQTFWHLARRFYGAETKQERT